MTYEWDADEVAEARNEIALEQALAAAEYAAAQERRYARLNILPPYITSQGLMLAKMYYPYLNDE